MIPATLRPATANDRAFVERVFFETQRWLIEELFGWRGDEYERQKVAEWYDEANTSIIVVDGVDIGWLMLINGEDAWELHSIFIAPDYQRKGLGTQLVRQIMQQAEANGVPLRLSTAKINPARNLYARLGFVEVGETEYKVYMERRGRNA